MTAGVVDAFRDATGREPVGVWSAPGRVNLVGEHTDYNDGFVLPFALDLRTRVAAAPRADGVLGLRSLQRPREPVQVRVDDLAPGRVPGWAAYAAGPVWALRAAGYEVGGLDVVVDGAVPSGAGLSSSAALECATIVAAAELSGLRLETRELARLAQRAENEFVGVPCGVMDQTAAMCCTAGHVLFLDTRSGDMRQVPFAPAEHGLAVLVVDTRTHHALADGAYADRRAACEEAARRLGVTALRDVDVGDLPRALATVGDETLGRRLRHVVSENARVLAVRDLLQQGRTAEIGRLLTASHRSLARDFEVSSPELDAAVDAALAAGAHGARMTGGGFGGSAIALVDGATAREVAAAVTERLVQQGHRSPAIRTATPSPGAGREGDGAGASPLAEERAKRWRR